MSDSALAPRRPLAAAAPLVALVGLALAACASGGFRTPLTGTDRPGYSFGTATVPLGGMQAEVGYTDTRAASTTYQTFGEGLLRIGAGPRTELRLSANSYALRSDRGLQSDGLEDAKFGVKHRLWSGDGASGVAGASLAVIPGVSVPVGSDGFGVNGWQPELVLSAALPLGPTLSVVGNLGDTYAKLGDARAHRLLATLAAWYAFSPRLGAFAEYAGTRLADDASSAAQYLDAGVAVVVFPAVQLDLRVGHGVNGVRNDNFIGLGVSRRW